MCYIPISVGRCFTRLPSSVLSIRSILLLLLNLCCLCVSTFVYALFQLWVGPGSKAAEEKRFFDTHLAPFYRIEQVLLNSSFLLFIFVTLSSCLSYFH
jgi:Niemann-Pick C1 protein